MLQLQHSLFGTHHSLVVGNIPAAINPFGYFDGSEFYGKLDRNRNFKPSVIN